MNYWLDEETMYYVFQTVYAKCEYDLPIDCDKVVSVTAVNAIPSIQNWKQSKRKLTLLPTPATTFKVVVEYLTR